MSKPFLRKLFGGTICLALLTTCSFGQGHPYGKERHHNDESDDDDRGDDRDHDRRSGITISFGTHDRDIIREYYHNNYSSLPPGLAKRNGNLPPGLQKHLERDGTSPPGLQKRLTPFPEDLLNVNYQVLPHPYSAVRAL